MLQTKVKQRPRYSNGFAAQAYRLLRARRARSHRNGYKVLSAIEQYSQPELSRRTRVHTDPVTPVGAGNIGFSGASFIWSPFDGQMKNHRIRCVRSGNAPMKLAMALATSALVGGSIRSSEPIAAELAAARLQDRLCAQMCFGDFWHVLCRCLPACKERRPTKSPGKGAENILHQQSSGRRLLQWGTPQERAQQKVDKLYKVLQGKVERDRLQEYFSARGTVELGLQHVAVPQWERPDAYKDLLGARLTEDLRSVDGPRRLKAVKLLFDKMYILPTKRRAILSLPSAEDEADVLKSIEAFDAGKGFGERQVRDRFLAVYPLASEAVGAACRAKVSALLRDSVDGPQKSGSIKMHNVMQNFKCIDLETIVHIDQNSGSAAEACSSFVKSGSPKHWPDRLRLVAIGFHRLRPDKLERLCIYL